MTIHHIMAKPILKFYGSKPAPEFFEHKNVEYNTSNKNKGSMFYVSVNNKNEFQRPLNT